MPALQALVDAVAAVWGIFVDVLLFWQLRLYQWWTRTPVKRAIIETLADARVFEEWEAAAYQLDEIQSNDLWRQNPTSKYYDYRLIYQRLQAIIEAREDDDIPGLVNVLRSGLVRNLGNITTPRLFNRAYAGTKLLIEDYITQVALAIQAVAAYPTTAVGHDTGLTSQGKLDLLHDTRQAFGRTALILQGGAIFGICHIGVVKALHLRGLLPRIIVGTGTGALIAALVGVHPEHELLDFLNGETTDLSVFAGRSKTTAMAGSSKKVRGKGRNSDSSSSGGGGWWGSLAGRVSQWVKEGYFLDVDTLEQVVRLKVGDLTFEEAYAKTKKVLNITILDDTGGNCPTLLNYLTAPNVLIRSAAVLSNSHSPSLQEGSGGPTLLCKGPDGEIQPWLTTAPPKLGADIASSYPSATAANSMADPNDSPLMRVTELFNVNHFLVSQARPYIVPFLQTSDILSSPHPRHSTTRRKGLIWLPFLRVVILEVQHRLRQLDSLGMLPLSVRRFLVDESIPAASLTLVPELNMSDLNRLLERPTQQDVDEWILRGERSVWPAIGALKVRCAVEVELDRAYQLVRRRKPLDGMIIGGPMTADIARNATAAAHASLSSAVSGSALGSGSGTAQHHSHQSHHDQNGQNGNYNHQHHQAQSPALQHASTSTASIPGEAQATAAVPQLKGSGEKRSSRIRDRTRARALAQDRDPERDRHSEARGQVHDKGPEKAAPAYVIGTTSGTASVSSTDGRVSTSPSQP